MKHTFIIAFVAVLLPMFAFAVGNVTVSQDITLTLPSDSTTYTLKVGSLNEFTINNSSFTFKLVGGDNVELITSSKKTLSNDASPEIKTTCGDNDSRIFMSVDSGGAAKTITVTPGSACTTASASSGGGSPSIGATFSGGGGGGGGLITPPPPPPALVTAPAPTAAETIAEKIAQIQTKISELRGKAVVPATAKFLVNLGPGSKGDNVRALQEFLARDSALYPEGTVNGYYGPLTRAAVQRFQEKYGIASPGVLGYGYVGLKTRDKLNELAGVVTPAPIVPALPPPVAPVVPPPVSAAEVSELIITRSLGIGVKGDDVRSLQEFLARDPEIYPEKITSGYYGSLTRAAVQRFQEKYGIASPGVPGYGYVGPKTRVKLQELTAGMVPSPTPAPASELPSVPPPAQSKVDEISARIKEIQQKILNLQSQPYAPEPPSPPPPPDATKSKIDDISAKIKEIQKKILELQK